MTARVPKLTSLGPGAATHIRAGQMLLEQRLFDDAVAEFERALDHDTHLPLAHLMIARAKLFQGKIDEARDQCVQALQLDPDAAEAHLLLGHVHYRCNQIDEAKACYASAVKLDRNSATARVMLARMERERGALDAARKHIRFATKLRPDAAAVWMLLAEVERERGDIRAAVNACCKAVKLSPNWPRAHYELGRLYQISGSIERADAEFQVAADLNPARLLPEIARGRVLLDQGRHGDAVALFESLRSDYPKVALLAVCLGDTYMQKEEYDRAIQQYEAAIVLNPALADSYVKMGLAHLASDSEVEARWAFEEALRRVSDHARARLELAAIFARQGDFEGAERELRKSVAAAPEANHESGALSPVYGMG